MLASQVRQRGLLNAQIQDTRHETSNANGRQGKATAAAATVRAAANWLPVTASDLAAVEVASVSSSSCGEDAWNGVGIAKLTTKAALPAAKPYAAGKAKPSQTEPKNQKALSEAKRK